MSHTHLLGYVGDPDQPLTVATLILAVSRLRLGGASGPMRYELDPEQASDIEAALVGGPANGMLFRGVPVVCGREWTEGRVVSADARVEILSSRQDPRTLGRIPDPRAASLSAEEIARLKAECEKNRPTWSAWPSGSMRTVALMGRNQEPDGMSERDPMVTVNVDRDEGRVCVGVYQRGETTGWGIALTIEHARELRDALDAAVAALRARHDTFPRRRIIAPESD